MHRCLVVANQTLGGMHLLDRVKEYLERGPCHFHIVVPATASGDQLTWTEGQAQAIARERLEEALTRFHDLGAEATGEVGVAEPMNAIGDALRGGEYDEILLSTLPSGPSRWLKQDLPTRVSRAFDVPVTHVVGSPSHVR